MVSFVSSQQTFLCAIFYCFLFLCCCLCFALSVLLGQVVSELEAGLSSKFLIITLWKEKLERLEILMNKTCSNSAFTQRDYMRDYSQQQQKKQFNLAYLSARLSRSFATASKNRTRQLQTITSSKGFHSIFVWCEKPASSTLVLHNNPSELAN